MRSDGSAASERAAAIRTARTGSSSMRGRKRSRTAGSAPDSTSTAPRRTSSSGSFNAFDASSITTGVGSDASRSSALARTIAGCAASPAIFMSCDRASGAWRIAAAKASPNAW